MSAFIPREEIVRIIRSEIEKYAPRQFGDDEDLVRDVRIVGDDLTAATVSAEKRLGVRVERSRYRTVHNVNEFADVIEETLQSSDCE